MHALHFIYVWNKYFNYFILCSSSESDKNADQSTEKY